MEEISSLDYTELLANVLPLLVYMLAAVNVTLFTTNLYLSWIAHIVLDKPQRKNGEIHLLIVIGSGGHTAEMMKLMTAFGNTFYPRTYVLADSDTMSHKKVIELEESFRSDRPSDESDEKDVFHIEYIPRSREVRQSYYSAIFSTIIAFFHSLKVIWQGRPNVVLCNGPGTGLPICIVASLLTIIRLLETRVLFVESICRVKTLSLTGYILYRTRLADDILVQWPELHQTYPRTKYVGRLV